MRLGVASHIWWDRDERPLDLETALKDIGEMGFSSAELLCDSGFFPGWGTGDVVQSAGNIRGLMDSYGLETTLHCPHYDMNISTWNFGLRSEVLRQLGDCLRVASALDAKILVVHPGDVPSKKFTRDRSFSHMVEGLKRLSSEAEDKGIVLCLENHTSSPNSLCVSPHDIRAALDEVGSESLKVCLDIAHVNSTGERFEDFIGPIRGDISHVHISDSLGGSEHLPIGEGNIDFHAALSSLKGYKGTLTLEGWLTHDRKSHITESRRLLMGIIGSL